MICAVSLNPAIDKYLRLDRLRKGEHQQAVEVITSAGGKAINVAGVLRTLGEEVLLLGFFGGFTGEYILQAVAEEGVEVDPVRIAAPTRTAFVLVEEGGVETEVVEPGGEVTAAEIAELRAKLRRAAPKASVIVLSGSVPPGCPADIYLQLLSDCVLPGAPAGETACPVLVDTSRQWLEAVVGRGFGPPPALIKPNRREAEAVWGAPLPTGRDVSDCLRRFRSVGIGLPVISDGAAGMYAYAQGDLWHALPPVLDHLNSVGSGDAAVAGFAAAMARGYETEEMLRLAAACGSANVLTKECAQVRMPDIQRLLGQIALRRLGAA